MVSTADGADSVTIRGDKGNRINTGSGNDNVSIDEGRGNLVETENGNDFIQLGKDTMANTVQTGDGEDRVENEGRWNDVNGQGNPLKGLGE
jgi:hypothetical protein